MGHPLEFIGHGAHCSPMGEFLGIDRENKESIKIDRNRSSFFSLLVLCDLNAIHKQSAAQKKDKDTRMRL